MLYFFIIFLSAFLLFQVQPLIAKLILPLFGGGAAIWTACLLFFQAFLLLGYSYAHVLSKCKSISVQVSFHSVALFTSLLFMPIGLKQLAEFDQTAPLNDILQLLILSIGVPYFLLSSTGPLVQKWLSYVYAAKADFTPYKLYSLSNIGSLLALLSYPFIFEPLFSLPDQLTFWSVGYILLVLLLIIFCVQLFKLVSTSVLSNTASTNVTKENEGQGNNAIISTKPIKLDVLLWLALSATGVMLLVSITNAMTQNIPPVPFLWILPLSLYLLTFIISFHSPKWYVRWYWYVLFLLSSFAGLLMFFIGSQFDILSQVFIYSGILLSSCMICHGELVKLTPSTDRLTLFYLNMSLGGFLGSAFVAFIAQRFFTQFLEFPIALVCVFVLLGCSTYLLKDSAVKDTNIKDNHKAPMLIARSCAVFAVLFVIGFVSLNKQFKENTVELSRNFYGILSVKDVDVNGVIERRLIDGTTSHGTQSQDVTLSHVPMSYYRANTGVALALQHLFLTPTMNVGLVGLGAGTLATYGRRGDNYTFYELNPNVERMARQYFTYIENSKANVEVVLGDGRVTLQKELDNGTVNHFDVLVIDAFSGDSVPAHLLTTEAFDLYFTHLKAQGVLAIHVSNSHLDLTALVKGLAKNSGYSALYFKTTATEKEVTQTEWVVVTNNQSFIRNTKVKRLQSQWPNENALVWTDNYSNLLSVLK